MQFIEHCFVVEMASKMAVYDTGYEDERFEQRISPSFHCIICTNVIKDAVMCPENEHLFCKACITRHLENSQTCPTCIEPLTVDTLKEAPRSVRNLLAELNIRCEFFDRGCGKFILLGDLESHISDCGFAPAVCSNEGCQLEVNKQDLLHHETAVCELRRVQCHSCNDIREEMNTMKLNVASINKKLEKIETNIVEKVEIIQQQLNKQEVNIGRVQEDMVEINGSLTHIRKILETMHQQALQEVRTKENKGNERVDEACVAKDSASHRNIFEEATKDVVEFYRKPEAVDEKRSRAEVPLIKTIDKACVEKGRDIEQTVEVEKPSRKFYRKEKEPEEKQAFVDKLRKQNDEVREGINHHTSLRGIFEQTVENPAHAEFYRKEIKPEEKQSSKGKKKNKVEGFCPKPEYQYYKKPGY